MFTVEAIAIGSEILSGQVLETNTHWICGQVAGMGGAVERARVVGDSPEAITQVLRASLARKPDSILTFGGLGPAADDLTLSSSAPTQTAASSCVEAALGALREVLEKAGVRLLDDTGSWASD